MRVKALDRKQPVNGNVALGDFLRSRRARLLPQDVGLPAGGRRHVEGLRRDEIALLASISVDYYTRLEQGRHAGASPGVLDALAAALRLPDAEHNYLYALAASQPKAATVTDEVRPETARLLRALDPTPAAVQGPGMDVLAANDGFRRLFPDFAVLPGRNAVRWIVSDPAARSLYGADWPVIAAELIGMLRLRSARGRGAARAWEVAEELAATSDFFRRVWRETVVSTGVRPVKEILHPEAGHIEFSVENLRTEHADGQVVVAFLPKPGSPDERAWHAVMAGPAKAMPTRDHGRAGAAEFGPGARRDAETLPPAD